MVRLTSIASLSRTAGEESVRVRKEVAHGVHGSEFD